MTALFLVLFASLAVAVLFLAAFIWNVRNDQFDDQQGSAIRMLYEDDDLKAKAVNPPTFNIGQNIK